MNITFHIANDTQLCYFATIWQTCHLRKQLNTYAFQFPHQQNEDDENKIYLMDLLENEKS